MVGNSVFLQVPGLEALTSVEDGMAMVTETHCRHLPVLSGETLVGVVSIGDLVKASLAEKDFLIKELKSYIKGQ